jgi:hypothetical protein
MHQNLLKAGFAFTDQFKRKNRDVRAASVINAADKGAAQELFLHICPPGFYFSG